MILEVFSVTKSEKRKFAKFVHTHTHTQIYIYIYISFCSQKYKILLSIFSSFLIYSQIWLKSSPGWLPICLQTKIPKIKYWFYPNNRKVFFWSKKNQTVCTVVHAWCAHHRWLNCLFSNRIFSNDCWRKRKRNFQFIYLFNAEESILL